MSILRDKKVKLSLVSRLYININWFTKLIIQLVLYICFPLSNETRSSNLLSFLIKLLDLAELLCQARHGNVLHRPGLALQHLFFLLYGSGECVEAVLYVSTEESQCWGSAWLIKFHNLDSVTSPTLFS
jgi:hypothetical protein